MFNVYVRALCYFFLRFLKNGNNAAIWKLELDRNGDKYKNKRMEYLYTNAWIMDDEFNFC